MPLTDLPGVPESALPDGLVLPSSTPAPPWRCRVEATVWLHRATPSARALLPAALPAGPALTVVALVRYLDSPVGAYDELLASPRLLAGSLRRGVLARVHVPFIAVDSVASVHGGRAHWALPKTLATFTRDGPRTQVQGSGWEVDATAQARGPWLPSYARLGSTQQDGAGVTTSSVTSAWALVRPATVQVETRSEGDLAAWLLPGRHHGLRLRGRMTVGVAGVTAARAQPGGTGARPRR